MTIVNIKVQVQANGAEVPAEGTVRWLSALTETRCNTHCYAVYG
ncbi:hypothetical protein PP635_gp30 [Arthrobacter phage Auxilium]|uniref:Uncharacterized protein n=1 Tax=Arthrobacter phage Auxilium TaxID=2419948 RepID=A0A3G2KA60_9CAUD|nr:hypothetical protein PP635_gp30 [Arthrobacter phage Auxilium]AYN55809.1 hypothetical protein PBI_AUXILIUM_30 [Arthrobacter phage Auxilium]